MPSRRRSYHRSYTDEVTGEEPASDELMERLRAACDRNNCKPPREDLTHNEASNALNALRARGLRKLGGTPRGKTD